MVPVRHVQAIDKDTRQAEIPQNLLGGKKLFDQRKERLQQVAEDKGEETAARRRGGLPARRARGAGVARARRDAAGRDAAGGDADAGTDRRDLQFDLAVAGSNQFPQFLNMN